HVYLMDASSSGRLSQRDLVIPEQGELEPVRLLQTGRAANAMVGMMKAEARPSEPVKAAVLDVPKANVRPGGPPRAKAEVNAGTDRRGIQPAVAKVWEEVKAPAPKVRAVTGRVRDTQGRPLVGVSVYVNPEPGAERFDSAATDREGSFVLPRL